MEHITFGSTTANHRVGRYHRILTIVFGSYTEHEPTAAIEVYKTQSRNILELSYYDLMRPDIGSCKAE